MEQSISERYKPIDGYSEYFITESGNVYSYRESSVGWQGLRKMSQRGKNNPHRYLQVCLCRRGEKKYVQVHRLVALSFCGGYFKGAVVNHIDGNIHNNHYSNLEWVTQKENVKKSYISSGKDQTRNYKIFSLIAPDGKELGCFRGRNEAIRFVKQENIPASPSSLIRHGKSKGFLLIENNVPKTQTTIREEYGGVKFDRRKCQPPLGG